MRPLKPLSRDAQIVAMSLFSLGRACSVRFHQRRRLSKRAGQAFAELEKRKMIEPLPAGEMPAEFKGWKATDSIGLPLRDYSPPAKDEAFAIFEDDGVAL